MLLLIVDDDENYVDILWNPSIKQSMTLPPLLDPLPDRTANYGLGYHPSILNYKVERVVQVSDDDEFGYKIAMGIRVYNHIDIHTVGTPSWGRIDGFHRCI